MLQRTYTRSVSAVVKREVALAERAAPASWPLSRTGVPSSTRLPNASVSASAQSTCGPSCACFRRSMKRVSLGCRWKSAGNVVIAVDDAVEHRAIRRRGRQIRRHDLGRDRAQLLQLELLL